MTGFVIFLHALICILLAVIILMQKGRGGGLTESFAAAESLFGTQTNVFLVRTTTVLASIFLVTSLSLAFLSSKKDRSLMSNAATKPENPLNMMPPAVPAALDNTNSMAPQASESAQEHGAPQAAPEVSVTTNSVAP